MELYVLTQLKTLLNTINRNIFHSAMHRERIKNKTKQT